MAVRKKAPNKTSSLERKVTFERVKNFRQSRFNPIRNISPENLVQQIEAFFAGNLRQFALSMDAIERRDSTLQCVAPKRKKTVARREWEVLIPDDLPEGSKQEAEAHKEALTFFYNNISVTNAIDKNERGGFALLVRQMLDAVGKKYAVHEIIWNLDEEGISATLQFVPLWFFENRTGQLRFLKTDFETDGEELGDGEWMVTTGDGIMEACAVAYMFKRLPQQAWLHYCDKHGTPGIQGKTDAEKGSDQWNNLRDAVSSISNNFSCVTSLSEVIEKIDLSAEGQLPYPAFIDMMDRALAALWRGADLSTISGKTSDAGQGASLQGDESDLLEIDDAALVSETLQMYLDAKVIEYTFGPGTKPLAYVKIIVPEKKDVDKDIKIDSFLIGNGFPISITSAAQRYGRPLPDAKEALLVRPQTISPFANEGAGQTNDDADLIQNTLAQALGVVPKWLAPVKPFLNELISKLKDNSMDDEAVLAFIEKSARTMPELLGDLDINAMASVLEAGMGTEVVHGLKDAIRTRKGGDQ
jgi:phage gp29-like protein